MILSPSPSVKIQTIGGKVCLRCKGKTAKHCWALSTNFWKHPVCWQHRAMQCLPKNLPPIFEFFVWFLSEKHCWVLSTYFIVQTFCWQGPAMFCLYTVKPTFPPIIWIFTEVEGDGIESRLPFKKYFLINISTTLHRRIIPLSSTKDGFLLELLVRVF